MKKDMIGTYSLFPRYNTPAWRQACIRSLKVLDMTSSPVRHEDNIQMDCAGSMYELANHTNNTFNNERGWPTSNPYLQKLVQDLSSLEKYQLREAEERWGWGRLGGMVGLG
ncbi:unnamed protein product [Prunus armeniaca]|uniref:Uncharacterized protein n=2 Tax=Prunus armeniaca TaxID=36596 RepID=A0A6J5VCL7_PRUAR|nr:unnamed protein product [Prunus armeniaca]